MDIPDVVAAIAAIEAPLRNVRRAIMLSSPDFADGGGERTSIIRQREDK